MFAQGIAFEELARLRHGCYRIFAALFLYPDEERIANLSVAAFEMGRSKDLAAAFPFFASWERLRMMLVARDAADTNPFRTDYDRLFQSRPDGVSVQPYESAYRAAPGKVGAQLAARVKQEYAVAGLKLSAVVKELPDHIAVELEFMAYLCGCEVKACRAEASKATNTLRRISKRERAFLGAHLKPWLPALARHITALSPGSLYSVAADAADAFVQNDGDLLARLTEELRIDR